MREASTSSSPVPDHGWAGRASWPSPICGRPHPSAARARLISSVSTPAYVAASCTLTRPSRTSLPSVLSMPSACPASPPPRLPWPSCPPCLGPPLSSGYYGPSVAPRRAGLPAGTTGWYGNRHAFSYGMPYGEAYSDHRHAYKMYFRMTLKGCCRSHNTLFLTWANVGTQECTQIGKNNLSASFWVICVHYCAASGCRMRFSSPGQTSSRLTERRTLRHRLTERRSLQPASWTKHPLHDLKLSKSRFT